MSELVASVASSSPEATPDELNMARRILEADDGFMDEQQSQQSHQSALCGEPVQLPQGMLKMVPVSKRPIVEEPAADVDVTDPDAEDAKHPADFVAAQEGSSAAAVSLPSASDEPAPPSTASTDASWWYPSSASGLGLGLTSYTGMTSQDVYDWCAWAVGDMDTSSLMLCAGTRSSANDAEDDDDGRLAALPPRMGEAAEPPAPAHEEIGSACATSAGGDDALAAASLGDASAPIGQVPLHGHLAAGSWVSTTLRSVMDSDAPELASSAAAAAAADAAAAASAAAAAAAATAAAWTAGCASGSSSSGGAGPSSEGAEAGGQAAGSDAGVQRLQLELQAEREAAAASAAEVERARAELAALETTKADTEVQAENARRVLASARKETEKLISQQVALQDELVGRSTRLQEAVMTAEVRAMDAEARALSLQAELERVRAQSGDGSPLAGWARAVFRPGEEEKQEAARTEQVDLDEVAALRAVTSLPGHVV